MNMVSGFEGKRVWGFDFLGWVVNGWLELGGYDEMLRRKF